MSGAKEFYESWKQNQPKMMQALPEMMKGFGGLFQSVMKDGAVPLKYKELIALGIGLSVRCKPCIYSHVKKCLDAGANRQEILEAASVAVVMQGGPSFTHIPEVIDALESCGA